MYNTQGKFIFNLDEFTNIESPIENNKTNTSTPTQTPTKTPTSNITSTTSPITTKKETVKLDYKYVYLVWILLFIYCFSCIFFFQSECRKYGLINNKSFDELTYLEIISIPIGLCIGFFILSFFVLYLTNMRKFDKNDTGEIVNNNYEFDEDVDEGVDEGCNSRYKYRTQNVKHSYNGYDYCYHTLDCAIDEDKSSNYCTKEWVGKASKEYIVRADRINRLSINRNRFFN
tara:strand:+ start:46 stop:735 length:690 start_codon:yes stop_codon:yes gene_type:complete